MSARSDDLKAAPIVFEPKPSREPPVGLVGPVHWLKENLFYSIPSSLFTLLGVLAIYLGISVLWEWGVTNMVWEANTRRECLAANPDGACWAGVRVWFRSYIYGRYPVEEIWRINAAFGALVLWIAPMWFSQPTRQWTRIAGPVVIAGIIIALGRPLVGEGDTAFFAVNLVAMAILALVGLVWWFSPRGMDAVQGKIGLGVTAVLFYPFMAGYLFLGGERTTFMTVMTFVALAVFIYNWLHVALCMLTGQSLRTVIVRMTGFADKHEGLHKYPLMAFIAVLAFALSAALGDGELLLVKSNLWGGLFLTLLISGIGITVALPLGIVLALARRSHMPIIRVCSITFIELFRSVPLITVLFMAVTMMPLFLPEGFVLNKLVQVIVGVCLFSSAYMAEIVRGGLQAIPSGQYEAAKSMGLNYWQSMNLIVLPQALKLMIPNIVGNFIGLLKDTTLVSIIGLYDMLLMINASGINVKWNGLHTEPLFLGACIFFVICYAMSQYSQRLERNLGAGDQR